MTPASLSTGTLTHSDIANHSDYSASSVNLSGGISVKGSEKSKGATEGDKGSTSTVNNGTNWSWQNFDKTGVSGAAAGVSSDKGSDSSSTRSGISAGGVTITDTVGQQQKTGQSVEQAVASVDRDVQTGDGGNGLSKNWNGQQLMQEQTANAQIIAAFGQQASKAAGTYADQQAIAARRSGNEEQAKKWDEGGEYRTALHAGIGTLTGGLEGAVGAAISTQLLPEIGEKIASLNLPDSVRDVLNSAVGAALGAVAGGGAGAAAGMNQAANNYVSHSPFREVRRTVSQENARLLNECGENCTQADFMRIDQQMSKLEVAANLAAIAQMSSMTQKQAEQLSQVMLELAPIYGNGESVLQLITGKSSLTGEDTSRFWAAIGIVPVAGGVLKKVGEPAVDLVLKILKGTSQNIDVALVNFGKVENQISHTFRHIEAIGLNRDVVKNAISNDLSKMVSSMPMNPYTGSVLVNGIKLDYVAYKLPDGTINIGRITPPR